MCCEGPEVVYASARAPNALSLQLLLSKFPLEKPERSSPMLHVLSCSLLGRGFSARVGVLWLSAKFSSYSMLHCRKVGTEREEVQFSAVFPFPLVGFLLPMPFTGVVIFQQCL